MPDPNGLNVKVAEVLTSLAGVATDTASLLTQLDGLRGVDNLTLGDLNSNLVAMRTDIADLTGFGLQGLNNIISSIGFVDIETSSTVLQLLNDLRDHIGFPTGDATTTLLGLLQTVANYSKCACGPQPPSSTDEQGCETPFVSFAAAASSDYGDRTFALWSPPPDGALIGTTLDPSAGDAELVPEATFDGWTAYVLSRGSQICSIDPSQSLVAETNQWIDLSGLDRVAFSVPPHQDIKVYICNHLDDVWTDCVDLTSTAGTYSTDAPFSEDAQFIPFTSVPGVTKSNFWTQGGHEQNVTVTNGIITSNMHGVSITLTSGSNVDIYTVTDTGAAATYPIHAVGDTQTIPSDTVVLMIHNLSAGSPAENPFTVHMCPAS